MIKQRRTVPSVCQVETIYFVLTISEIQNLLPSNLFLENLQTNKQKNIVEGIFFTKMSLKVSYFWNRECVKEIARKKPSLCKYIENFFFFGGHFPFHEIRYKKHGAPPLGSHFYQILFLKFISKKKKISSFQWWDWLSKLLTLLFSFLHFSMAPMRSLNLFCLQRFRSWRLSFCEGDAINSSDHIQFRNWLQLVVTVVVGFWTKNYFRE